MADFIASTCSNSAAISNVDAVRAILERYYIDPREGRNYGPLEQDGKTKTWRIGFWNDGWFAAYSYTDDEINDSDECSGRLLKEIQPYLKEPLVIQSIGAEKLRYPFAALEIVVPPKTGRIRYFGFKGEERLALHKTSPSA